MRINLPVFNVEQPVPEGEVLVSKTDLKGIVTYCNRIFSEISGFTEAELIGAPHNLIRHPDVPSEFYEDCWNKIKAGHPWHGVIKNRCKNGNFYWVEANVTPWIENNVIVGYVSLRYRATKDQISAAEASYRAVRNGLPISELFGQNESFDHDSIVNRSGYEGRSNLHYIVELQQRLAEKVMALEKYHDRSEEEMRIGSDIMLRINSMNGMQEDFVRQKITPAAHYSGDMILATRTPADVLHILLADAVGHGVTAAMNVLPLSQAFHAMSKKGFDISRIAEEMNHKIHKFMPADRFVAAILVSIDFRNQLIEVWNGGNPSAVLFDKQGEILHKWNSRNLPLGICDPQKFSAETEVFHFDRDCQMYLFSDGFPEAESPDGIPFGKERIELLLKQASPEKRFDELIRALELHLCGRPAHDDVSLAMVNISQFDEQIELACRISSQHLAELESDWRVAINLGANELKYVEVVPFLTQLISRIHATRDHHSALFLILSELFNNALDHGILQLDSKIKCGVDGFENYLQLREQRLRDLDSGNIELEIEKVVIEGKYGVKIRVADSGNGFDYSEFQDDEKLLNGRAQFGRGIALVKNMSYKLEFVQRGNEVVSYYICS